MWYLVNIVEEVLTYCAQARGFSWFAYDESSKGWARLHDLEEDTEECAMALLNLGDRKRAQISRPICNSVLIFPNSPYLQAWQSTPAHLSSNNVSR